MDVHDFLMEVVFLSYKPKRKANIWQVDRVDWRDRIIKTLKMYAQFLFMLALCFFLSIVSRLMQYSPVEMVQTTPVLMIRQFAVVFMSALVIYTIITGSTATQLMTQYLLYGAPSTNPSINHPWFSRSLRETWSKRWKHVVSELYRKTIFDPLRSTKRYPTTGLALFVFIFSGFLHEYQLWASYGVFTGDQILFFMLHFLFCTLEVLLEKPYIYVISKLKLSKEQANLVENMEILFTFFVNFAFGVIFIEPFFRYGFFAEIYHMVPAKHHFEPLLHKFVTSLL